MQIQQGQNLGSRVVASDGTELDPTAVTLARAIRQKESNGDYNAIGDEGESHGAYQFNKNNFQDWATKYKLDPNDITPVNQDKVAYARIKDLMDQGHSQSEIAALWNGAHKENGKYVANNPSYVEGIKKNYNQLLQQPNTQPIEIKEQAKVEPESGWDTIKNLLMAGVANLGKTSLQDIGNIAVAGAPLAIGGLVTAVTKSPVAGSAAGLGVQNFEQQMGWTDKKDQSTETSTTLPDLLSTSMTQANENTSKLLEAQSEALQKTQWGRTAMQNQDMVNGLQTTAMFGWAPEIRDDNSQDYSKALQSSNQALGKISGQVEKALATEDTKGSFTETYNDALKIMKERLNEYEWEDGKKEIDKVLSVYGANAGGTDEASLGVFQKMKQETGWKRKWGMMDTTAKKEALKALSIASRNQVESKTKNKDLYNASMKLEQNIINAQKIMKHLNGKKAPRNEGMLKTLLHAGGKAAAVYIGDKVGGPVGALIGYMMENNISKAVDKKYGKTIFESPAVRGAIRELKATSPEAYKVVVAELDKQGVEIEDLMQQNQQDSVQETVQEVLQKHNQFKLPDELENKLKSMSSIAPQKSSKNTNSIKPKKSSKNGYNQEGNSQKVS
jgi:hypothetical protein